MKKAKASTVKAETYPRKAIPVQRGATHDETGRNFAVMTTSPEIAAFRVINAVEAKSGFREELDVPSLLAQLRDQAGAVNTGDLSMAEAMLMNQGTALQSLFSMLTARAIGCDTVVSFEVNMRMALRAQSQCRATLETLAAIKNPPVIYARQANVTTGPQQVVNNQGTSGARARAFSCAHAGESENPQSQLSGGGHELLQDARASGIAGGVDSALETVGEIDRTHIAGG